MSHLFARRRLRVAFVGSWVPRHCGIATFTRDLRDAVVSADPDAESAVLAIDEPGVFRICDRVLGDPELQRGMEARAAAYGRQAAWPAVGAQASVLMRTIADRQPRHAWGSVKYLHALGL